MAILLFSLPSPPPQLLLNLNKVHTRSFVFLVSFMKRLLRHSEDNGLDPKLLGMSPWNYILYPIATCVCDAVYPTSSSDHIWRHLAATACQRTTDTQQETPRPHQQEEGNLHVPVPSQ